MLRTAVWTLGLLPAAVLASYYDVAEVAWNLNANEDASHPLEYSAPAWQVGHEYNPSPKNWRFPFYSLFLDRFVNGDPTNDNINGTSWEHDLLGTQLRHGGDITGLQDTLDYLHGLGIRGLYIAGSPMINMPWESDSYSPYDQTILDHHFGNITEWRKAIQAIHDRGMYVILDNTFSTMSSLFLFDAYMNASAPFSFNEHNMNYGSDLIYRDYEHSNEWNEKCPFPYPRFWDQGGHLIDDKNTSLMVGCRDSEFDQYGDVGAFGIYPEWQKQLSRFGGVQDRLRDWRPSVLEKINHFSCLVIEGLDIDGYRMDKAMQITVDSLGNFSNHQRDCANRLGKSNFMVVGEIVNGNADGSVYLGRGKEPSMAVHNITEAVKNNDTGYIRAAGNQALDGAAFHYSTYRALMRFLGLDGDLLAANDAPINFQEQWETFMRTNDMFNAMTGEFDPRHMYGVSNQDVFRWPGMTNGTARQLLGDFIVTLAMPGIPLVSWGEEQAFYTLDSTASNYIFGRQAMSSAQAWQMHGCYKVGDINLNNAPFNSSLTACKDDSVSLDHRDPSHPLYTVLKEMFNMRQLYPVLNDGWTLRQLSNQTFEYTLPGSFGFPTVTGLWSVLRGRMESVQDLSDAGTYGNQGVWLLYSNYNGSRDYTSDCQGDDAIISPFDAGTIVKNMFYPFEEWTLAESNVTLGIENSTEVNGCLPMLNMTHYGWKAFVPVDKWTLPIPAITGFSPGHDARLVSNTSASDPTTVDIEVRFSREMDCDAFRSGLSIISNTDSGKQAVINQSSISCSSVEPIFEAYYTGPSPSIWKGQATVSNVYDGIHVLSVNNITASDDNVSTGSKDNFMFRIGQSDNPMVFPFTANYSSTLLFKNQPVSKRDSSFTQEGYYIQHKAAGADKWRYSMSFGAVWSDWFDYVPGNATLPAQTWTGSSLQSWEGDHVVVDYWSRFAGSSDHRIEGDLAGSTESERRFPHLFLHGPFNRYGADSGLPNQMSQLFNGTWAFDFMTEWPAQFQINVWGMAANGQPDVSYAFGDVDNDTVLDRISPVSLEMSVVNITNLGPPSPALAWRILVNDADLRYYLVPVGSRWRQLVMWIILAVAPVLTAISGVLLYMWAFYGIKFNQIGLKNKVSILPLNAISKVWARRNGENEKSSEPSGGPTIIVSDMVTASAEFSLRSDSQTGAVIRRNTRTVLIATMEYDISDWDIKIKIGGLGVMAQLMGKNLQHQDLVWVVPCVGGIDYPVDTPGLPIEVSILGRYYDIQVQYHILDNITYVLLDAPVFRRQTPKEPYPARMDDLDSAIYYSTWNQCIAETMRRFRIDLYHINDYHGTVAPLYLLPETIPCCLSLHNAEFQGLWPMRTPREAEEICSVFNLPRTVVSRYVQFGEVFNLLHAGASILRIHQKGFGAVGVSKKYGKRSWARYPIFWGLNKIGALPNPDPTDVAEWDRRAKDRKPVTIDDTFEQGRAALKRQAQEWADLEQRSDADLFVFVGRWSMQKGIDLIADVFPAILEQYPHTQLICVGPTIDLHGKFAALKLDVMMKKYPGRVYSKPEFTALPPFIFSGAEFALIPSRDEPFGLVAVEFGRKGALGVGSRVGGLGQMPGWWYTIESTTTKHQIQQFKMAITGALKSDYKTRAMMRARSAKQRFPVAEWKADLEILQSSSIDIHNKRREYISRKRMGIESGNSSGWTTPTLPGWLTPRSGWATPSGDETPYTSIPPTRCTSPVQSGTTTPAVISHKNSFRQIFSLGLHHGPGHSPSSNNSARPSLSRVASRRSPADEQDQIDQRIDPVANEEIISGEQVEEAKRMSRQEGFRMRLDHELQKSIQYSHSAGTFEDNTSSRRSPLPVPGFETPSTMTPGYSNMSSANSANDSAKVVEEKIEHVQDLTPFFTDPTGLYFRTFEKELMSLSGKTSESKLCIEEYLAKSEKQWFHRLHVAKMTHVPSTTGPLSDSAMSNGEKNHDSMSQFLLPQSYLPPTGIRRIMVYKLGDWPVYTLALALGQILAANSYQITLLSGQVGQTAEQLYIVASIYLATTFVWWYIFRRFASRWCLSLPWLFYGIAFFMLAFAPFASNVPTRGRVQQAATVMYAIASSSGSLFFAQNFGSTGAVPVKDWAFRACAIQGTQQLYTIGLWAWGDKLTKASDAGSSIDYGHMLLAIGIPIGIFLWIMGVVIFIGLPDYYRQKPGAVPDFYSSVFRRKIIVWFLIAVFIQNIILSAPYGRNWAYLFASKHAPGWAIFLEVLFFFVAVWAAVLWWFAHLSTTHSWILPLFAVGLGAPRWAQILWSTSNIGTYLPWAGSPIMSALLGRGLWLWLGVLDSLQGIGYGMILMQTMVRFHVSFALMAAQIVGSVATIIARADGLNSVGPGPTFPDFSANLDGLGFPWFWVGLLLQLVISVGFFAFFRKEQLTKP